MEYAFRLFLYYVNRLAICFAFGGMIYSLIKVLIGDYKWHEGLISGFVFLAIFIGLGIIYIVRKSKLPAAGKDYR